MTVDATREDERIYSSRGINVYLQLLAQKYPHVNIPELLLYARMKPYEVADQGYWFTQEQIDRFYEKARQLSGNDNIAREAGRYAASSEVLGVLRQYVLGQVGLANAYGMIGSASENYARSAVYRTRKLAPNRVEIEVSPKAGIREKPYQCENRIGLFEAVALGFTNKLPQVEHQECIFKGDPVCRYIITWENAPSAFWLKIRNLAGVGFVLLCLAFGWVDISLTLTALLPVAVTVILLLTVAAQVMEKRELQTSLANLRQSSDDLIHQVNVNYNNVRLTHEIGQAVSRKTHSDDILANVVRICENRLDYDRGMILLADGSKQAGWSFALVSGTTRNS